MLILILLLIIGTANAFIVCDDATGPNCNVDSTTSFANTASVTYTYTSTGNTVVDGVTYDVVVRWNPEAGAIIDHSWQIIAESKRATFDCTNSRMWFNGITVDATSGFTGSKNNIPMCIFNMQTGILTSAYLNNPGSTVFFLFQNIATPGDDM